MRPVQAPRSLFRHRLDNATFAAELSFLIRAGLGVHESLCILRDDCTDPVLKNYYSRVVDELAAGHTLGNSLAKQPETIHRMLVSLITIGEQTGTLGTSLRHAAEYLRAQRLLRRKVTGALIYPALIALVSLALTLGLIGFVFPKITPLFLSLEVPLPALTTLLLAVSHFVSTHALALLIGAVLTIGLTTLTIWSVRPLRCLYEQILEKIPIIGPLLRDYHWGDLCRSLAVSLNAGLPLSEALTLLSRAHPLPLYRDRLAQTAALIVEGAPLQLALATAADPPRRVVRLISAGERTGTLAESLLVLADQYTAEVEIRTKNLTTIVEPVLLTVMGTIVGLIAVSIMVPIYSLTNNLNRL
jgi:type II secretory pathway component PulF